ncbi:DUF2493 domain-containing protein [Streptomyces sp. NPDC094153]|uniref:DUF2493 domain-containing protein n=1 Tax=Streptomyces sp. NPDC094153 TaxID=3366058 RepID=UPI00382DC318
MTAPRPYRILITGSRDWADHDMVRDALTMAIYQNTPATIIHGACPSGADAMASWWIRRYQFLGLTEERHPANWQQYGKAAGPRRNTHMVNLGADVCLAFIRNSSRGASHTAALAEAAGIPTRRFTA